jgi:hypothetical protein
MPVGTTPNIRSSAPSTRRHNGGHNGGQTQQGCDPVQLLFSSRSVVFLAFFHSWEDGDTRYEHASHASLLDIHVPYQKKSISAGYRTSNNKMPTICGPTIPIYQIGWKIISLGMHNNYPWLLNRIGNRTIVGICYCNVINKIIVVEEFFPIVSNPFPWSCWPRIGPNASSLSIGRYRIDLKNSWYHRWEA